MNLVDKLKDYFTVSEEEYYDDVEQEEEVQKNETSSSTENSYSSKPTRPTVTPKVSVSSKSSAASSVIDFGSSVVKPHVVFAKLSRFDDVGSVATSLNEKKIVILNLEDAEDRESRRVIDFLYGVAFANGGQIKRVATRTFVLTPHNIPFTGELLDELSSGSGVTLY